MTILEINGKRVEVGDEFKSLSPDQQAATVEEIAQSMNLSSSGDQGLLPDASDSGFERVSKNVMGQVNRGIVNGFEAISPFNAIRDMAGGALGDQVNYRAALQDSGIAVAEDDAQTAGQAALRGLGGAALGAIPAGAVARLAGGAGGMVGTIADDAAAALTSKSGYAGELMAGAAAGGAAQMAENAGYPDWVQNTAAIAAPMAAAGGATGLAGLTKNIAGKSLPGRALAGAKKALAPYTKAGATEVARQRLQSLAGGYERAEDLARQIGGDNPLNLTPAQQTGDQNMLALEQLAAEQDPLLREALAARRATSEASARDALAVPGNPADTKAFFESRRREFKAKLDASAQEALGRSADQVQGIQARSSEADNSARVHEQVKSALDAAKAEEGLLWQAVPRDATVGTSASKAAAQSFAEELGRSQADDLPARARELLLDQDGYGDQETVREMHGLYSRMREVARSARAGNNKQPNLARVADGIADSILEDLGAYQGTDSEIGQAINEARAFSAAMHETFDQGAPGRILRKTLDGDTAIDPELALKRTVGRGGVEGQVTSGQLEEAGADARYIEDFLRGQFAARATDGGTGDVSLRGARSFLANNKELLGRYPGLQEDILKGVRAREGAEALAKRVESRIKAAQNERRSSISRFIGQDSEKVIGAAFKSDTPAREIRKLANAARKDPSGEALAGLKSSLAHQLTKGFKAGDIQAALENPKQMAALKALFSPSEIGRFRRIAGEMAKLEASQSRAGNIGNSLSGAEAPAAVEYIIRVFAARSGANLGGGGGGSLQTAQMASSRARDAIGRLTNDKASQMIADAITDPKLMRALLTEMGSAQAEKRLVPALLPYLVGASSALAFEE